MLRSRSWRRYAANRARLEVGSILRLEFADRLHASLEASSKPRSPDRPASRKLLREATWNCEASRRTGRQLMGRLHSIAFASAAVAAAASAADRIEFNRDIRPILSENCFACHGPDGNARQAGLRLDRRADALARGVIQPGDSSASRLVQRVGQADPALVMPPVATDKRLTEDDKRILADWVDQGAKYQEHWAYIPPKRPDAPKGPDAIDHLIGRKLGERGLRPVGEASRRTLARRLSFDLTGLPPDPDSVDAFVRDSRQDAYRRLVDSLLESPHYGERMAATRIPSAITATCRYASTPSATTSCGPSIRTSRST